ncbi:hypothetical protein LCGC14_2832220, partial [marine sediment metagenome]
MPRNLQRLQLEHKDHGDSGMTSTEKLAQRLQEE